MNKNNNKTKQSVHENMNIYLGKCFRWTAQNGSDYAKTGWISARAQYISKVLRIGVYWRSF